MCIALHPKVCSAKKASTDPIISRIWEVPDHSDPGKAGSKGGTHAAREGFPMGSRTMPLSGPKVSSWVEGRPSVVVSATVRRPWHNGDGSIGPFYQVASLAGWLFPKTC